MVAYNYDLTSFKKGNLNMNKNFKKLAGLGLLSISLLASYPAFAMKPQDKKQLNHNCLYIVSKYFNTIEDCINAEKTCKEYRGIMEEYKKNFVPLSDQNEARLLRNIQTYYVYGERNEFKPK